MQASPFQPIARIAVGFSAEVWACRVRIGDSENTQVVRIYHCEVNGEQYLQTCRRIRLIGGLSQIEGIAPYYAVGEWRSRPYVITPLADYDCAQLVKTSERDQRLHLDTIMSIVQKVALTLDVLMQMDIGHGSVCPSHIVMRDAQPYLIGASQMHKLSVGRRQNTCVDLMALGCRAPESLAGTPGQRSDQFSLAATYLSMRTGTVPICNTTWIEGAKTTLGENERFVVARALAPREGDRFTSCSEFSLALQQALSK